MSLGEVKTEIEQGSGPLFEVGEFGEGHCGFGVGPGSGVEFARGSHVKIVVGIDIIEDLLLFFGREVGTLLVNPTVQIRAGDAEPGPIIGVMGNAVMENEVVQLKNGLLQMTGDPKALQLYRVKLLAEFACAAPGRMARPTNQ